MPPEDNPEEPQSPFEALRRMRESIDTQFGVPVEGYEYEVEVEASRMEKVLQALAYFVVLVAVVGFVALVGALVVGAWKLAL